MERDQKIGAVICVAAIAGMIIYNVMKLKNISKKEAYTPTEDYGNTRGYRNNNPLNIRLTNTSWKGKVPNSQNTDGSFEQFTSMAYGFRAAMINIRTIVNRGYNTIQKMIEIWAPDSDGNNSTRYAQRVSSTTGYSTTAIINPSNAEQMKNIAYAMAIVENGTAPQWKDINEGWNLI